MPFYMKHPDVERTRNIPYGPIRKRNLLDVYRHKDHPTGAPVLLFVHGGGWTIGNKDQQGLPAHEKRRWRRAAGCASRPTIEPEPDGPPSPYSSHSTWKRALAWIRAHAAEYGGDPNVVAVTGGSAGGHLAALVASQRRTIPRLQPGFEDVDTSVGAACVPFYGV